MAATSETSPARRRTWRWYVGFTLVAIVLAALAVGGWMLYTAVSVSLQAENNLHATLFTIRLVEQFVHQRGRWPKSWSELEQIRFRTDAPATLEGGHDWPGESPHLQECVTIDFGADVNTIIEQDPMKFEAIRPNGPCYPYRHYGLVESLQETLRKATAGVGHKKRHPSISPYN